MRKVSLICPTQDRVDFYPWLAHVFHSFSAPGIEKELVVVDSSLEAEESYDTLERLIPGALLRYAWLEHGSVLGQKRNRGLDLATGDLIGWLDDDDGRAPSWLEWAVEELADHEVLVVKTSLMFIHLGLDPPKARWVTTRWYSAGLYSREICERVRFIDAMAVSEDVNWHGRIMAAVPPRRRRLVLAPGVGVALTHDRNTANGMGKPTRWRTSPPPRPQMWTEEEWKETVNEMMSLRKRLGLDLRRIP